MARLIGAVKFVGKFNDAVGMGGKRGKSFVRSAAATISNPRSMAQCIQRMICATAGVSIAPLKEICNNSVEGKRNGNATLSYLRGQWMRMLRVEGISQSPYNYAKKGSNFFIINPYMLSKGSLAAPAVSVNGSTWMNVDGLNIDAQTPAEAFPSVAVGNQITIVTVALDDLGEETRPVVKYCRFAFKSESAQPFVMGADGYKHLNPQAIDLSKAAGDWSKLAFQDDEGESVVELGEFCGGFDLAAVAFIVSNLVDKKRSTSFLQVGENVLGTQYPADEAWRTFSNLTTEIDVPSEVYLNNSTNPTAGE